MSDESAAAALRAAANKHYSAKNFAEALDIYANLIEQRAKVEPQVYERAIELSLVCKKTKKVFALFSQATKNLPHIPLGNYFIIATELCKLNAAAEAEKILRLAGDNFPENNQVLTQLIAFYENSKQYNNLFRVFKDNIGKREIISSEKIIHLAGQLREITCNSEAIELLQVTHRKFPQDNQVGLKLLELLRQNTRWAEAVDVLGDLHNKNVGFNEEFYIQFASFLVIGSAGNVVLGKEICLKGLRLHPNSQTLVIMIIRAEVALGNFSAAKEALDKLILKNPAWAANDLWLRLATLARAGLAEAASAYNWARDFLTSIREDNFFYPAYKNFVWLLNMLEKGDDEYKRIDDIINKSQGESAKIAARILYAYFILLVNIKQVDGAAVVNFKEKYTARLKFDQYLAQEVVHELFYFGERQAAEELLPFLPAEKKAAWQQELAKERTHCAKIKGREPVLGKPNVAVLCSGLLNKVEFYQRLECLIENNRGYNIFLFFVFFDKIGNSRTENYLLPGMVDYTNAGYYREINKTRNTPQKRVIELFKPAAFKFVKREEDQYYLERIGHAHPQWYYNFQAYELSAEYARKHNIQFDYCLRLRLDNYGWEIPFDYLINKHNLKKRQAIVTPGVNPIGSAGYQINDRYQFGNSEAMKTFCEFGDGFNFFNLESEDEWVKQKLRKDSHETHLAYWLQKRNIEIIFENKIGY